MTWVEPELAESTGLMSIVSADVIVQDPIRVGWKGLILAYPNPSGGGVHRIRFNVDRPAAVTVRVYDLAGMPVYEVVSGSLPGGMHEVIWSGIDMDSSPVAEGTCWGALKAQYDAQDRDYSRTLIFVEK